MFEATAFCETSCSMPNYLQRASANPGESQTAHLLFIGDDLSPVAQQCPPGR